MDRGVSKFSPAIFALVFAAGLASATQAAEQKPPGAWVIESAIAAPWADPAQPVDSDEPKRLIGKTVTFGPKAVEAPAPMGCAKPVYAMRHDRPDMLFQGALAEPDKGGKPRDATALAHRLGMTTATVVTYEIGCSEFEFHALRPGVLVFGLNDRVYTMRPLGAAKPAPKGGSAQ
jgi:hypothetical protein